MTTTIETPQADKLPATPLAPLWKAGDSTHELRWMEGGQFKDAEFIRSGLELSEEATAKLDELLRERRTQAVTVVGWVHQRNLPGCLPEVVAKSSFMTVYELTPAGQVAARPIDIHERSY